MKFRYYQKKPRLKVDEAQPFYLMGINNEDDDDADEEIKKKFHDNDGRFQFRWFLDFLLEEIREKVVVIMRSKGSDWGLRQKTTNSEFEKTSCEHCRTERCAPYTRWG